MLSSRGGRKAKHPLSVRILVRQSALDQPVQDAIEGYTVERQGPQSQFDLVVRQCRRRGSQQLQNADSRRCGTRAATADLLGDSFNAERSR